MSNNKTSTPPQVLLLVEKLYIRIIEATLGFNNVLKTFVVDGLADSLRGLQSSLNLAQRSMGDKVNERIRSLEEAIIHLDTLKSYLRIAMEYGVKRKSGGLTYTASAEISDYISNIEKQVNTWKSAAMLYRDNMKRSGSESTGTSAS